MPQFRTTHKRFSLFFLSLILGFIVLSMAFNILVDPWDLFHSKKIPSFNQYKVSPESQTCLYKASRICEEKPTALILGSSRMMAGIDPDHLTQITGEKAYNAGFAGANFEEIYDYFKHTLYNQPDLKVIVIGLDLFAFNESKRNRLDFSKSRLGRSSVVLYELSSVTLGKDAFLESFKTIKANYQGAKCNLFKDNGHCSEESLKQDLKPFFEKWDTWFLTEALDNKEFYGQFKLSQKRIDLFKQLVQECKEKGIALYPFFSCPQAIYWETLYHRGLFSDLEKLKRTLSALHPIWDFSGYNIVTANNEREQALIPYYTDCSHFSPFVGHSILNTLFDLPAPLTFGRLLTPATIEESLRAFYGEREQWLKSNPELAAKVAELIQTYKKEN